jgi:hypothetical protein
MKKTSLVASFDHFCNPMELVASFPSPEDSRRGHEVEA